MSTEANKAIVRQIIEAFDRQEYERFDGLMLPELARELTEGGRWVAATFDNHRATITELIAEGDIVVAHVETRGGHCGEWEGIAPTGIQWTNTGFELFRFADGKIVSFTMLFDVLNHLTQLGATITPPVAPNTQ